MKSFRVAVQWKTYRSRDLRCSIKKGVLTNSAIFSAKHLCWSLLTLLKLITLWTDASVLKIMFTADGKNFTGRTLCVWERGLLRIRIAKKMKFSIKDFFSKCDTFTEEILNGKRHFLCSVVSFYLLKTSEKLWCFQGA